MVITDKSIRKMATESNLISPFSEENLQSESYDVTIGSKIAVMKKEIRCLDVNDPQGISDCYEDQDIPAEGYTLSPKQFVLVSLTETINLPDNITAHLRPKTSCTRAGLLVSAQHCNSTYSGQLRIGLFNATDYPIRIHCNFPIAQIIFETLDSVPTPEKQYKNRNDAHYQNEGKAFVGPQFSESYLNSIWNQMLDK